MVQRTHVIAMPATETAADAGSSSERVAEWAAGAYDRVADGAWSLAMAVLRDEDAAAQVIVDTFRDHSRDGDTCLDITLLTSVVQRARSAAGTPS